MTIYRREILPGDTRTITRFALFPIRIKSTIKWLEMVRIHQTWGSVKYDAWNNDWFVD